MNTANITFQGLPRLAIEIGQELGFFGGLVFPPLLKKLFQRIGLFSKLNVIDGEVLLIILKFREKSFTVMSLKSEVYTILKTKKPPGIILKMFASKK